MNDLEIKIIACGPSHTFIYKDNGDLLGFGGNMFGQLGLYDFEDRLIPTLLMNDKNIKMFFVGNPFDNI